MATCDNILYGNLDWCKGALVLPGIRRDVYAIAKRDIVSWPTLASEAVTAMNEIATYTGSFTLAAAATWKKVGVIVDKSPVRSVSQGTKPSKTFLNTATLFHQGVEEDATAFARQANNDDLVYAIQAKNGKWRILGNEMFQTETEIEQELGGAVTDEMGTKLNVSVTDVCPAPFYTGTLVTADGTVNGPVTP